MKRKVTPTTVILHIIVYIVAIIFLFPFAISIFVSFKSQPEIAQGILTLPEYLHFENYIEAMERAKILQSFRNSIIVTGSSVLLIVFCSAMAGYAIGRNYRSKGLKFYELILLASFMLPFQTIMIPIYRFYKSMELINTFAGAIIIIVGTNLAFATMIYIGFVKTLPKELEEAARIEGYGDIMIFFRIIFPLLKNTTFTVATLMTLWIWNEFNISLIMLQKNEVKTIPMQQYVFFSQYSSDYHLAFAAAVITMIPIVIFFIFAQKHIVKGLTDGAVKG